MKSMTEPIDPPTGASTVYGGADDNTVAVFAVKQTNAEQALEVVKAISASDDTSDLFTVDELGGSLGTLSGTICQGSGGTAGGDFMCQDQDS